MTLLLAPAARLSSSPDILADVMAKDCNLAIWERSAPAGLEPLLDGEPGEVRFSAPLSQLAGQLADEMDRAGFSKGGARDALIADVAALAVRYGEIMGHDTVQLRLEIVTTDSCRKFHADYVKARLITTYIGTGTQWIDAEDAARVAAGEEPRRIETLDAGHVGLFKGKLASDAPAIHRSPPISQTGEKRLLLVLNPPTGS